MVRKRLQRLGESVGEHVVYVVSDVHPPSPQETEKTPPLEGYLQEKEMVQMTSSPAITG